MTTLHQIERPRHLRLVQKPKPLGFCPANHFMAYELQEALGLPATLWRTKRGLFGRELSATYWRATHREPTRAWRPLAPEPTACCSYPMSFWDEALALARRYFAAALPNEQERS